MITYCYCDKCGKPVTSDFDEDGAILCKKCALELYHKIFYNNPQRIKGNQT